MNKEQKQKIAQRILLIAISFNITTSIGITLATSNNEHTYIFNRYINQNNHTKINDKQNINLKKQKLNRDLINLSSQGQKHDIAINQKEVFTKNINLSKKYYLKYLNLLNQDYKDINFCLCPPSGYKLGPLLNTSSGYHYELIPIQKNTNQDNINNNNNQNIVSNGIVSLNDIISDLSNLSSQLSIQKDTLAGICGIVAGFLGFLSTLDFGTTAGVAIAVGIIFAGICTTFSYIIHSVNNSISTIESNLGNLQISLVDSKNLSQTQNLITIIENRIQNSISNLEQYTWVIGVNNAINELNNTLEQLEDVNSQILTWNNSH